MMHGSFKGLFNIFHLIYVVPVSGALETAVIEPA